MNIETYLLTGPALDWAVAKCEGGWISDVASFTPHHSLGRMCFSTDWSQGGPIIAREKIDTEHWKGVWAANMYSEVTSQHTAQSTGTTPLIAAMRCYVASKLGDSVEVPAELCK